MILPLVSQNILNYFYKYWTLNFLKVVSFYFESVKKLTLQEYRVKTITCVIVVVVKHLAEDVAFAT